MNEISNVKMAIMTIFGLLILIYDWIKTPFKKRVDPMNMTSEQRQSYLLREGIK